MNDCVTIECVYNDKLRKGMCIGVSQNTRSYHRDVIRMCWIKDKPVEGKPCHYTMQSQMTPLEAVKIGVALIRSSIIGDSLLRKMDATKDWKVPDTVKEGEDETETQAS